MLSAAPSFAAATIAILNNDGPGEGFNDPTAATPVGGNPGTTLGAQRLNAFQRAVNIWGATLDSSVVIVIRAQFDPLTCTATSAVLGSAGAVTIHRDFANAPFAGTQYSAALANKLAGSDLSAANPDINATFNSNLGQTGCFTGTFFYLGYDNNHGNNVDLIAVLLHEFAHGLGFQTFTSNSTGAQNGGFPSIYDRFLMDDDSGKSWLQMTNAERQASAINSYKLSWTGPRVFADVPSVLAFGIPVVKVNSPAGIAGSYGAGTAGFGPAPTAGGITGDLLLANDGGGVSVTDGCEAFPPGFFAGKVALIDRGTCTFKTKTLNAQNASATAVIIVNNVAGTPAPSLTDDATITTPITIPTVSLTLPDGNTIKAQLAAPVNATVQLDTSVRAGTDPQGKALLNAPNPVVAGSSVSHWDPIATPNILMEPAINGDLTHNVIPPFDLTFSLLRETGWSANALPNSILASGGNNQMVNVYATAVPFQVTINPPVAGLLVTFTAPTASGTFASSGTRIGTAFTNASGVATSSSFTAGANAGTFTINATVPGPGTVPFTLTSVVGPLTLNSAVSRKTHGASGTFDVPLPPSAPFGIESRTSASPGNHTIVITFANTIVSGSASVSSGTGSVSGSPSFSANTMSVSLTGITDVQQLTVTLSGVTDSAAQTLPDTSVTVKFLLGDVVPNSAVNGSDVGQTKAVAGNALTTVNFRADTNVSGGINASDIGLVKANTGRSLP
ncbi:MAG: PA domain-containing protein [Chthoniobacterales bacterium]